MVLEGEASSYAEEINAPLSMAALRALKEQLSSGNYARYKRTSERTNAETVLAMATEDKLTAFDWQGNTVEPGTRIIWHNDGWRIGRVLSVKNSSGRYGKGVLLSVEWYFWEGMKMDDASFLSHSVHLSNCMVWPEYGAAS